MGKGGRRVSRIDNTAGFIDRISSMGCIEHQLIAHTPERVVHGHLVRHPLSIISRCRVVSCVDKTRIIIHRPIILMIAIIFHPP